MSTTITRCRANVGLANCPNEAASHSDICALHASLKGAWAQVSLRRPLTERLHLRAHPPAWSDKAMRQGEPR